MWAFQKMESFCGGKEIQGVCHTVALPFTLKKYLIKAKEELWKVKYFAMQKCNLQKIL
jgi:hypothetical protein